MVVKVSRGWHNPEGLRQLREACESQQAILLDRVMSHDDLYGLMRCCDAYLSLHRSEGYGLTLAEVMALGKPVIATGYSGNLDFMTAENSYLVKHRRVTLSRTSQSYREGCTWAEPDVDHAASLLRRAMNSPAEAKAVGEMARRDVREKLSLESAGRRMAARLAELGVSKRVHTAN